MTEIIFCKQIKNCIEETILSVNTNNWDDMREEIFDNLMNISSFCNLFDNYIPCENTDTLYVSEIELKTIITNSIYQLSKNKEDVNRLVDVCVEIMKKKQMNKYYNPSYSTCPCPISSINITQKQIQHFERFIKKEKYNAHNNNNNRISPSITNSQAIYGLTVYNGLLEQPNGSYEPFAYPANFCHIFALYKSLDGKIYVLYSTNEFMTTYKLIDETWFTNYL
jgi:hypothetical protein